MVDMIGQLLASRYQIIRVLGAGGFSQTYVAQDTHIPGNPTCVVKHLKPASNSPSLLTTARQLFQREAETLVKLGKHEQIPQLLAYFEEDEEFYLVQEFIEGETLATELPAGQSWQEQQVMQLLEEILGILVFVHSHGVIHRDIKPDNIIRRAWDNKLVLIDFGAIKQVQSQQISTEGEEQTVAPSTRIGTPGYSPTEQDRGKPRPSSDIYALGMIGVQALTGVYPDQLQEDDETGELIWKHQAQVSPELAAILTKMVRYHFKDRYQSAEEALLALQLLKNASSLPTVSATISDRITDSIVTDSVVDSVTHAAQEVHELLLEWVEGEKLKTQPIRENQRSKNPGTVRLGRDPALCDIVLSEPTVSGLHAEIFFNPQDKNFYLRSLRESNPPIVDKQPMETGEVVLHPGSNLRLGELALRVIAIELKPVTKTREFTPTQMVQQVTTPPQPVAPTRQPSAVPTTRRNKASSSAQSPIVEPARTPTNFDSTSDNRLPFLIGLGMAALLTVGGAYAYVQSQSNKSVAKNPVTANSDTLLQPNSTDLSTPNLDTTLPTIPTDLPTTNSNPTTLSIPTDLPITTSNPTITSRRRNTSLANSEPTTDTSTDNSEATPKPSPTNTSTDNSEATPKPSSTDTSTDNSEEKKPTSDEGASVLEKAIDKAKSEDFQAAIDLAKQIPSSSSAYQQAQKAIAQWQEQQQKATARKEAETRAKSLLADAQTAAKNGGISDLQTAIELAAKAMAEVPKDSTVYQDAEKAITQWRQELAAKAEQEPETSSYTCSCESDAPDAQKPPASTQSESDLTGKACTASDSPQSSAVGVWKCEKKPS